MEDYVRRSGRMSRLPSTNPVQGPPLENSELGLHPSKITGSPLHWVPQCSPSQGWAPAPAASAAPASPPATGRRPVTEAKGPRREPGQCPGVEYQCPSQPAVNYLSHGDVLKLRGQREDPEKLDLTQGGLQQLIVGLHRVIGDVVVAGYTTQFGHLSRRKTQANAKH